MKVLKRMNFLPCFNFLTPAFNPTDALFLSWIIRMGRLRYRKDRRPKTGEREIDSQWVYISKEKCLYDLAYMNKDMLKKVIQRLSKDGFIWTKKAERKFKTGPKEVFHIKLNLKKIVKYAFGVKMDIVEKKKDPYGSFYKKTSFLNQNVFFKTYYIMSYKFKSSGHYLFYHWLMNRNQIADNKFFAVPVLLVQERLGFDRDFQIKLLKDLEKDKWLEYKVPIVDHNKKSRFIKVDLKKLEKELLDAENGNSRPQTKSKKVYVPFTCVRAELDGEIEEIMVLNE